MLVFGSRSGKANKHTQIHMAAPKRYWTVIRAVDYRLQALADIDNPCWEELSADTIVTDDREAAFQLARKYQGLLCSADGLPSPRQSQRFAAVVAALRDEHAAAGAGQPANAAEQAPAAAGARNHSGMAEEAPGAAGEATDGDNDPY